MLLGAGSDLASSCVRLKIAVGSKVVEANAAASSKHGHGRAVFISGDCITHIMHRESESNGVDSLIRQMYSTAWVFSLLDVQSRCAHILEAIVRKDLSTGFFPGVRPPDNVAQTHSQTIASVTLLRIKLVRARVEDGDYVDPNLVELQAEFCQLCNGDTRKRHCVHFCFEDDCCDGHRLEVAILRFVRLFMQIIFSVLGVDLPSPIRWYTYSPHMSRQTLGQTTYGILPRVLDCLVGSEVSQDDANDNEADSYHASVTKKKRTSWEFHAQPDCGRELLCAVITTTPCDLLSHRLQHLDHFGGSLSELVDRRPGNLLTKCQRTLWDITHWALPTERSGDVPALLWLDATGSSAENTVDKVNAMSAGLGATVFIRIEKKFHEGPAYRWMHHLGDSDSADREFQNGNRSLVYFLIGFLSRGPTTGTSANNFRSRSIV